MKLAQNDQSAPVTDSQLASESSTAAAPTGEVVDAVVDGAPLVEQVSPWQPATEWLILGGPIVWILIGLATIALAVVLLKVWQFMVVGVERIKPVRQALDNWDGGSAESVIEQLHGKRDPTSIVVSKALVGLANGFDQDVVREECQRLANAHLERLRSFLKPLAFIGTTAPLLGLLGTVIGMIAAFQGIQEAGSQVDPTVLSGGIWEALLTTAVGLTVAIPVTMAHTWLERKLERLAHRIEDAVAIVFTAKLQAASRVEQRQQSGSTASSARHSIGVIKSNDFTSGARGAASA